MQSHKNLDWCSSYYNFHNEKMTPLQKHERLMEKAAKAQFNYTIAWMKVMNAIAKAQQKEQEQRDWACKGFLGYKNKK